MSLYTVYQPIYLNGQIFAYESFLRGSYPPEYLFRMAKAKKMSSSLDMLAIRLALQNYHNSQHSQPLFLNMLPSTFQQQDIVNQLKPLLKNREIIIEITEQEELFLNDNVRQKAIELSSIGVQIALDDFGKGYNNLLAIDYLQPKYIKLDANLTNNLFSPTVQIIVQSIVGLSNDLKIQLIAEGVETKEQMDILQSFGIHYLQGFYLGKPDRLSTSKGGCLCVENIK